MSWPHFLSLSRVVAGPVIAVLILAPPGDVYLLAAVLFVLASLTDAVDGKLARYSQRVSPLGVFLDTTADKVMVSLVLISMAIGGLLPAWIPLIIIGREFLISGLRSFAASCDVIISAHAWGKGKTAVTMAGIACLLVMAAGRQGGLLGPIVTHGTWTMLFAGSVGILALAAALTIVSGVRYLVDARPLFRLRAVPTQAEREERRRIAAGGDG